MPTPTGTISGVSYKRITALNPNEEWVINPFDINGNLLAEITIEVDTTSGNVILYPPYLNPYDALLDPYYSIYGLSNIIIKIVKITNDPQTVYVSTVGQTSFSGTENGAYTLESLNDTISLTPIGITPLYEVNLNWKLQNI